MKVLNHLIIVTILLHITQSLRATTQARSNRGAGSLANQRKFLINLLFFTFIAIGTRIRVTLKGQDNLHLSHDNDTLNFTPFSGVGQKWELFYTFNGVALMALGR